MPAAADIDPFSTGEVHFASKFLCWKYCVASISALHSTLLLSLEAFCFPSLLIFQSLLRQAFCLRGRFPASPCLKRFAPSCCSCWLSRPLSRLNLHAHRDSRQAVEAPEQLGWRPVQAVGFYAETFSQDDTTVTTLRGGTDGLARLRQADFEVAAETLVVFDIATSSGHQIRVFAEDRAEIRQRGEKFSAGAYTQELRSTQPIEFRAKSSSQISTPSALMSRARGRLWNQSQANVLPVAAQADLEEFSPPQFQPAPQAATPLSRRIQIRPRSNTPAAV